MYPRNAASPERIGVGAVVQISDGAVQTSGVSISVRGQGGASGAGAGTTAYDNGIVEYTPTQGETDFTSFIVVAHKTGCIPVSQTIITSASSTPGYATVDAASVRSAVGLASANLDTQFDALPTAAEINAEVVDALATDTHSESAGVVGATASIRDSVMWLKTLARNKVTQTSTTQTLRNNADSGNIATAGVSDDGVTFVRDKWA